MRNYCLLFIALCVLTACGSKSKEELYAQGLQKVGAGAHDAAVVFFKNALEKDANYVDARYQLGKSYQALGKLEQAEKEFQKVMNQNPSRQEVHLDLARVFNSRKMPEEALKEAEAYLKAFPGNLDGIEVQGVAYSLQKNFVAAEQSLLQVVQADQKKTQPKLELAAVYLNQKREQEGRRLLDEVIAAEPKNSRPLYMLATLEASQGNTDKALAVYNRIVAANPNDVQALYKSGTIHIGKGDIAKAEAMADDLIKRLPKRGEGYRLKGLVQYQQKKYPDAIATLQNSIKMSPNIEGYYYLGLSLFHKGELESALSQFRKIIDVAPTFTNARLLTALILLNQKRVDDAITEIRKVLEQNDQNALAHNVYGSALIAKGQYDEGMKELNRATAIDPKIVDAHLKKGIFKLSRGKVAEAESDLSAAVQVAPDILNSRLLLASFQLQQGKAAKAREVLKGGLKGGKGDAVIYNSLAGVAFADKKKDEAVGYLAKAKEVDPLFASAYYNLAAYYASQGKTDAAKAEYQAFLQRSPKDVRAFLGLATLAEIGGKDAEALDYYGKANETKEQTGILALAAYHAKKKEINKAIKVLNEGLKALPRNVHLLEMKGRLLVADKKFADAVKVFDDIEQESKGKGIVLKIGAYVAAKDYGRAEEQARRIIALQPKSAGGYLVLASVFESQKNFSRALEEVRNGLKVDATNLEAFVRLGNLYAATKDTTRAMNAYGEALKVKRDFVPAMFSQGALLESTGKKIEAVKRYREVLAHDERYVPAMNNLAFLYADGFGPKEEALRLAIGAFRLEPSNAAILDTVGYALLVNGKKPEALKALKKAGEVMGQNPSLQYHLAMAYRDNNQKGEAQQALQKALASGEFPERAAAQKLKGELR